MNKRIGVLLINLGTPSAPSVTAIRKYLKQFLSDPRVIELPGILRWILVNAIILPFRAKKTTHAYSEIWQESGSPLLVNSIQMQIGLQNLLGGDYVVVLGMRYGEPCIDAALQQLYAEDVEQIIVLPLFPQYASAVNGSAVQETFKILAREKVILPCTFISAFWHAPEYINASAEIIKPYMSAKDFLLMSFHGLPEKQLINPGVSCYKTHCINSAAGIANSLGLDVTKYAVSFQSRLGRLPWIKPYTEEILRDLRTQGIENLVVACPSFVADCLETLEEIGIRTRQEWLDSGGKRFQLVPCLNAQPVWLNALQSLIKRSVV